MLDSLHFHMNFRLSLAIFTKKRPAGILIGTELNVHQFEENLHVNNTLSSSIWTQSISIFMGLLNFCQHCFVVFHTQVLCILSDLSLCVSYFWCYLRYFKISVFNCLLIVYRNIINLCIMILYLVNFQNLLLSPSRFCRLYRIF